MSPEEGVLYTPEQVSENGWLGEDTTPSALRKAAGRKPNQGRIEHTRFQGRIYFTAANIRSIHETGLQPADEERPALAARRSRRAPMAELQPGVPLLQPRPDRRRRRAS